MDPQAINHSTVLWLEVAGFVIALLAQIGTLLYIAGRYTKAIDLLVVRIDKEGAENRLEQDQQWSKMNGTAEDVSFIKGQLGHGKPNGKGASH